MALLLSGGEASFSGRKVFGFQQYFANHVQLMLSNQSFISKSLVDSDIILMRPNLRVLMSMEFLVTGRSVEHMIDN